MLKEKRLIYIRKRTAMQWLTIFIVVMPLILQALLQFFNFPSIIKYTIDIAWIATMVFTLRNRSVRLNRKIIPFVLFIAAFGCFCLITYLLNYQSVFYFLWGFRNNFRFYFAFLAIILLLESDDIKFVFNLVDVLFVINFFVSLYQFFVLGLVKDYCGGIFGTQTGSNASTLILFSIVVAKSLLEYMNGTEKMKICFLKCATALLLAAFAEIKFFYVIFALILIITSLLTTLSLKKIMVIIISVLLAAGAGSLYTMLFEKELSISSLLEHFTYENYASAEDVGRFTAIPRIAQEIHTDWLSRLFGMGLGNCDTSSFAICNTPFFQNHYRMNYIWFSSACWFLETGFVGLVAFLAFFCICFAKSLKLMRARSGNVLYAQLSVIMAVLCVLLTFYNSSLRTEVGFLAFFVLALPYVEEN